MSASPLMTNRWLLLGIILTACLVGPPVLLVLTQPYERSKVGQVMNSAEDRRCSAG